MASALHFFLASCSRDRQASDRLPVALNSLAELLQEKVCIHVCFLCSFFCSISLRQHQLVHFVFQLRFKTCIFLLLVLQMLESKRLSASFAGVANRKSLISRSASQLDAQALSAGFSVVMIALLCFAFSLLHSLALKMHG